MGCGDSCASDLGSLSQPPHGFRVESLRACSTVAFGAVGFSVSTKTILKETTGGEFRVYRASIRPLEGI